MQIRKPQILGVVNPETVMNTFTLDGQFLDSLTNERKRDLWQYYRLLNTPPTSDSIDDEFEQLESIWKKAEDDPTLCKWLELIDYFCTSLPETDEQSDNDKRAYLSEHLEVFLQEHQNSDHSKNNQPSTSEDAKLLIVQCPNGTISVRREITSSGTAIALKEELCGQCNEKLGEHHIFYPHDTFTKS